MALGASWERKPWETHQGRKSGDSLIDSIVGCCLGNLLTTKPREDPVCCLPADLCIYKRSLLPSDLITMRSLLTFDCRWEGNHSDLNATTITWTGATQAIGSDPCE